VNHFNYLFFILAIFILGGCSGTTPINDLSLPPVSTIEGIVTKIDKSGFMLKDSSGSIYVRAEMPGDKKLDISVDEQITVYGNLQGGTKKVFDGYVIRKTSGEQIIITNPSPHFGFILQTSFK
jgi:hypothetical protein